MAQLRLNRLTSSPTKLRDGQKGTLQPLELYARDWIFAPRRPGGADASENWNGYRIAITVLKHQIALADTMAARLRESTPLPRGA